MSVTALPLPDPGSKALDQVSHARDDLTAASGTDWTALSDQQLEDATVGLAALESQAAALRLQVGSEAERRAVEANTADTGTDAWLSKLTGERRELLKGGLRLARRLKEVYAATLEALGSGTIRLDQARVIVEGLDISIDDATTVQRQQAESLLIAKARGEGNRNKLPMPASQLRRAVRRIYRTIDHELHERHLARSTKASERRGRTNTWMTFGDAGNGVVTGRFSLPELHGNLLKAILQNLSSPRRLSRDKAGKPLVDETPDTTGEAGGLGWADIMGRAFCELLEHLPTDRLPRGGITMLVQVTLDALRDELTDLGVATTSTALDLTAAEARRLACEAGIVPVVLGGESQPLDLGRTRRLHTEKQRQALSLIHDTCAIAGCNRPFEWTEVHHPIPWSEGGSTDLDNAIPVCWSHHRSAHNPRFELIRHDQHEWVFKRRRKQA